MGKHVRIIKGGRGLRKDGLDERRGIRAAGNARYWPTLSTRAPKFRRASRGSGSDTLWSAAPLAFVLVVSTFWGVWTLTAPGYQPEGGIFASVASADTESASFTFCHSGGGTNCVVDGDTLFYEGTKIRIADIDTPETHDAQCDAEQQRGDAATQRLISLVNAGPFTLESIDRDEDRYGRKLRLITRSGESLGGVLVDEGLARWYRGGRMSWC